MNPDLSAVTPEPRVQSKDLKPGTVLVHRSRDRVTLECRKGSGDPRDRGQEPVWPGWWLAGDVGGLADFVIDRDDGEWTVVL